MAGLPRAETARCVWADRGAAENVGAWMLLMLVAVVAAVVVPVAGWVVA